MAKKTRFWQHPQVIFLSLFLVICLLAGFFRIFRFATAPSGVLVDEASIGYNAFSLLKTGKDEHGTAFPLVFRAFGDQKLPAYIYATVPSVAMFGLNATGIRFPSVVAGVLITALTIIFMKSLKFSSMTSLSIGLVAAVSPWTVLISRFGYESNLALLFFLSGLVSLVYAIQKKQTALFLFAGAFFGLTWYTYIAYRLTTIIFIALFATAATRMKLTTLKQTLLLLISFALSVLPILPQSFSSSGTARFTQIGILSDPGPLLTITEGRTYCAERLPRVFCDFVWNKGTEYSGLLISRTARIFSPEYLFLSGDKFLPYLQTEGFGQFPLILFPVLVCSVIWFLTAKEKKLVTTLVVAGIISAIVPSILSGDPQKIRLTPLIPFLMILFGLGLEWMSQTGKIYVKRLILSSVVCFVLISGTAHLITLITLHADKYDLAFNTHVTSLMQYLQTVDPKIKIQIVPSFSDPIMYYAFHTGYDPAQYQKNVVLDELEPSGFQHAKRLENVEVTRDPYKGELCTLYITDRNLGLHASALQKEFRTTNGVHPVLYVYSAQTKEWCPSAK